MARRARLDAELVRRKLARSREQAAALVAAAHPAWSPAQITAALVAKATPGTVASRGPDGASWTAIRVACGGTHLAARVTCRSADELGLVPGRPVFAIVKSVSLDQGEFGR